MVTLEDEVKKFIEEIYKENAEKNSSEERKGFEDSILNSPAIILTTICDLCKLGVKENYSPCLEYIHGIGIAIKRKYSSFPENLLKRIKKEIGKRMRYYTAQHKGKK